MTAHMGPLPLAEGASDREAIFKETGVSGGVRYRQQWGQRCLSLSGPAEKLPAAKILAE